MNQMANAANAANTGLSPAQRVQFDEDGFVLIEDAIERGRS